ncbi:MAG: DEAD/DEAH box helicase [Devosia sp.]|nr:DEAD/DEAH box helicase [Devosia sp.]
MQWSPQQDQALKAVAAWLADARGPQVFRLFGWAGTGKSTLAQYLAQDAGNVVYAAFTGKAALVMRRRGCSDASTIHSLIYRLKDEKGGEPEFELNPESEIVDADLVVIDEVSMVGADLARDLLSFGKKVLVLGDPFQLPPVKDDTGFFTEAQPDIMLTEIHRQAADNPIIRMSMDIREGRGLEFGVYGQSKVIHSSEVDREEALAADQILVGRNKTRITYNDRVRSIRGLPHRMPVPGDRLICLRNNRNNGLLNGQIWSAKQVRRKGRGVLQLLLEPEDGSRVADQMVTTHEKFFMGQETDLPWHERRKFDEFYFGYCITTHKAQGSQWDHVYLFDEGDAFREDAARWRYTAVTRAAERLTVVM